MFRTPGGGKPVLPLLNPEVDIATRDGPCCRIHRARGISNASFHFPFKPEDPR